MKVMSNPYKLHKPTIKEAKQICKSAGFKSKVETKGYKNKNTTVVPLGNSKQFINELIGQKFYIVNGGILCES